MSTGRLVSGSRTGRRALQVVFLAAVVVTSAFAGGAFAGDGGSPGDAPDERQSAQQLEAGATIEGNLSDGDDVDWYAVDVTSGEAVVARLGLQNTSGNRSVEVNVYDASGDLATEAERDRMSGPQRVAGNRPGSSQESTAEAPDVAESTGTYYVEVRESRWNDTDEGVSSPYNLTVTTETLDAADPNENGTTATPIEVGQSVEAVMTPYDHDVYAVDLTAGENYTIAFNHTSASASRFSKTMTLHTDASNVTDDDPGFGIWAQRMTRNASGTYTAEESGTHYLRLGQSGVTVTLLERADYRLTVTRTDPSTDDETDGGDEGETDGGNGGAGTGDTPVDDGETPTDGNTDTPVDDAGTSTGDAETPLPDDPEPADDGTEDGEPTPSGTVATTDTVTRTATDGGDATPTDRETATIGGGGGGSNVATQSPTAAGGPGFGAAVAVVSLLGAARIASRRSR